MITHNFKIISELNKKVNSYFDTFKTFILNELSLSWNKENLTGKSYAQWNSFIYFKILYLFILIDRDIKRNPNQLWGYFEDKYKLKEVVSCANCHVEFDYAKAKTAFKFDLIPITPPQTIKSAYDLDFLRKNPYICLDILENGDFDVENHSNQDIFNLSSNGNNIIVIGDINGCNFDAIRDTIDSNNGDTIWDS